MSRVFDDYIETFTRELLDFFGYKDSIYTPETGSAITLDLFFTKENENQVVGYDGTIQKDVKRIQVLVEDMQGLDYHGTFTVDGNNYTIEDIDDDNGYEVTFLVKAS